MFTPKAGIRGLRGGCCWQRLRSWSRPDLEVCGAAASLRWDSRPQGAAASLRWDSRPDLAGVVRRPHFGGIRGHRARRPHFGGIRGPGRGGLTSVRFAAQLMEVLCKSQRRAFAASG